MKIAIIQMNAGGSVEENLRKVDGSVKRVMKEKPDLILLPEDFAFWGPVSEKQKIAESLKEPGPIINCISSISKMNGVYILAGGVPVLSGKGAPKKRKITNTSILFDPKGKIRSSYNKIHLFDADVAGKRYRESDFVENGTKPVLFKLGDFRFGVSICYDLRFPELYRKYSEVGANALIVTAAFTRKTGIAHWETLLRARAIENQCYVLAAGQCGDHPGEFQTYGNSMVISPWGEVLDRLGDEEGHLIFDLSLDGLKEVRKNLPCLKHRYF